jgi:repressor LexA
VAADLPELTGRQAEILALIEDHTAAHGYPPTFRDLMAATGIRSPNGIKTHLSSLERKGYIRRDKLAARGIVVVDRDDRPLCPFCQGSGRQTPPDDGRN